MARPRGIVSEPNSSLDNKTGTWRTERPVFKHDKCTGCKLCVLVCPDGVVHGEEKTFDADLTYCKGCGICAAECPVDDIEMILEVT
jgi:pyruvate ferredoxin oxidoreductase delta subunit